MQNLDENRWKGFRDFQGMWDMYIYIWLIYIYIMCIYKHTYYIHVYKISESYNATYQFNGYTVYDWYITIYIITSENWAETNLFQIIQGTSVKMYTTVGSHKKSRDFGERVVPTNPYLCLPTHQPSSTPDTEGVQSSSGWEVVKKG